MATEKRLIDANKLLKIYKKWIPQLTLPQDQKDKEAIETCIKVLEDQPTVDAVEVVRCKDCKHYDNSEGIQWCKINSRFYPGGFDWHCFPEDGYCSYGEMKDSD